MVSKLFFLALLSLAAVVSGCETNANTIRTISTGSSVPVSDEDWQKLIAGQRDKITKRRFVVWGNHSGATHTAIERLQREGNTVVERARLQEIFEEQKIRLTHTSDDDASILKVGRLVGADRVVFVETSDTSQVLSTAFVGAYGGASRSETVHNISVAVRAVNLETGEIRWSGHATFSQPVNDPEAAMTLLTIAAINRATCPLERGEIKWVEFVGDNNSSRKWGCQRKDSSGED